ncbi:MAG: hypothetical protein CK550_03260, partial [Gemmatimonadetes bacterium]
MMNPTGLMFRPHSLLLLGAALLAGACARPISPVAPPTPIVATPVAPPVVLSGLPVVPTVRGAPIDVRVRYPADNQLLT